MGGQALLMGSKDSGKIDTLGIEEIEQFTFSIVKNNH